MSLNILQYNLNGRLRLRHCRDMRRHQDTGMIPERVIGRQWLVFKHVEDSRGDMAAIQCGKQIVLDQISSTTRINDDRPPGHGGEACHIQNSSCRGRQRQKANQNVASSKKYRELIRPCEISHTIIGRTRRPAPGTQIELKWSKRVERGCPEHTGTHDSHGSPTCRQHAQLVPFSLPLLRNVINKMAMRPKDRHHHILGHSRRNTWLNHTNERDVIRNSRKINMIETRSGPEYDLKTWKKRPYVIRYIPGDQIPNLRGAPDVRPDVKGDIRGPPREDLLPFPATNGVGLEHDACRWSAAGFHATILQVSG